MSTLRSKRAALTHAVRPWAIRARLPGFEAPFLKPLLVAEPVDTGLDLYADELDQLHTVFDVLDLLVSTRAGQTAPSSTLVDVSEHEGEVTIRPVDPSLAWLAATFRR